MIGTKLSFDYEKNISRELKYPYEESFYCKEHPSEVLPILIKKYHVSRYNTVTTNLCDKVEISAPQDYGTPPRFTIEGLNIVPYDTKRNGPAIAKSVDDFTPGIPESDFSIRNANIIIDGMIIKFLVKVKVLDLGRQAATNYLRVRDEKKDDLTEQHLKDILAYGKAALGQSFSEKYILHLADQVVKSIPSKFDPHHGPNNPGLYH